VQICTCLYVTVDGMPQNLQNETSREHLSDVFALLGESGWIHSPALDVDVSSPALWSTVLSSVTAPVRWVVDVDGADGVMTPFLAAGPS
jgi:hypothetical protein